MDIPGSCTDYRGRHVAFPNTVVVHVRNRHPEMSPHLDKVCEVLAEPNLVYFRERTNSRWFYQLGVLSGRLSQNYMVVIVRYDVSGDGVVRTAFSTGRPAYGDALEYLARG